MHIRSAMVLFESVISPFLNAVITLSAAQTRDMAILIYAFFIKKKEGLSICDLVTLKKCLSQNSLNTMLQKTSLKRELSTSLISV